MPARVKDTVKPRFREPPATERSISHDGAGLGTDVHVADFLPSVREDMAYVRGRFR